MHALAPILILAFPLAGAILALFTEKKAPRATAIISTVAIGLSFVVAALFVALPAWGKGPVPLAADIAANPPAKWITTGANTVFLGFHIDHLAAALLFMVTLCSTMIHVFSNGYMAGDPRFGTFFRWIGFFTFSMLGLIVSDNLLTLFVCWELMAIGSTLVVWCVTTPGIRSFPGGSFTDCQTRHSCSCRTLAASIEYAPARTLKTRSTIASSGASATWGTCQLPKQT